MKFPFVVAACALALTACGSDSAAPAATTTELPTTTVQAGADKIQQIVEGCEVAPTSVQGGQIVIDRVEMVMPLDSGYTDRFLEWNRVAACVAGSASAAGQAVLGTASAITGPQKVTEDGLTFTQIYSGVDEGVNVLTVQVAE